jgi:threonine synthase
VHRRLQCALCGREHPIDQLQNLCTDCGRPLEALYDLAAIRAAGFTPERVRQRALRSMWRFHEVMTVDRPDEAVSLGEGGTPLLRCRQVGPFERFENLWVKDEALNPTGSFKARGMSAAVTRAVRLGAKALALPSAGNAAGAAAHYAARAGLPCHLFMPADTPPANIIESHAAGAHVYLVNGLISDCGKLVKQGCGRFGWFDLSTLKEPFRLEGKKTMGYELAFDVADALGLEGNRLALPDCIVYPAGGGTGLIGMWKAFDEMQQLGWIGSERPRMVLVQATGCAPIVRAYEQNAEHAELFPNAATVAAGLRVPAAVGDFMMIRAVRASQGTALTIDDAELLAGAGELESLQGLSACPEGGAAWKAAERLLSQGWIRSHEKVVVFNTGSGLKYNHLITLPRFPVLDQTDPRVLDQLNG